jgi:hypothetical protein
VVGCSGKNYLRNKQIRNETWMDISESISESDVLFGRVSGDIYDACSVWRPMTMASDITNKFKENEPWNRIKYTKACPKIEIKKKYYDKWYSSHVLSVVPNMSNIQNKNNILNKSRHNILEMFPVTYLVINYKDLTRKDVLNIISVKHPKEKDLDLLCYSIFEKTKDKCHFKSVFIKEQLEFLKNC